MRKSLSMATGLLAGTLVSPILLADDAALERRIAELEQTVNLLARKLEVAEEVSLADKARAAPNGRVKADSGGVTITGADSSWDLKVRALSQFDGRFFIDDGSKSDTFTFRRFRPMLEAKLGKHASFRFTGEYANEATTLVDGYVDVNLPWQSVLRAGQFKAPVGLERLQSGASIFFIERAFPTELAPNRDRGVQLSRGWLEQRLKLDLAWTSGTPDGRDATVRDNDGEKEISVRLFFEPLPGIGFGVSGSQGDKAGAGNAVLQRYRSPAQNVIFTYRNGVEADGEHSRFSPQAYAFVGPFGAMAEYIESEQELLFNGVQESFQHDAWQLTAVYSLTGEDQSFRGVKPTGQYGAWELALRYSELNVDGDVFATGFADPTAQVGGAKEYAVGVNWTITPQLKAFANYTHTEFDGGAGASDRDDEKAVFTRLQVNF